MRGVQRGWCGRKLKRVRDLSCGNTHVYLEYRVRARALLTVRQGEAGARSALTLAGGQTLYTKRLRCMRTSVAASGYSECGQDQILTGMRSRNRKRNTCADCWRRPEPCKIIAVLIRNWNYLPVITSFSSDRENRVAATKVPIAATVAMRAIFFLLRNNNYKVQIQRAS